MLNKERKERNRSQTRTRLNYSIADIDEVFAMRSKYMYVRRAVFFFLLCVVGCVSCFCALQRWRESEDDRGGSAFDLRPCLVCV